MRARSPLCRPRWELVPKMTSPTSAVLRSLRWAMAQQLQNAQTGLLGDGPEHGGTQMLRVLFSEGTFAFFADAARCAAGVDYPCV